MIRSMAVCLLSVGVGLAALAPSAAAAPQHHNPTSVTAAAEPMAAAAAANQATPAGPPNPLVQLTALSCSSTGACGAVGTYDDSLRLAQGLFLTEAHGRWKRAVEAQPPANAAFAPFKLTSGGGMADISCRAAGSCTAVGRYEGRHNIDHAVLFTETHGHWRQGVEARLPANAIHPVKPKGGGIADNVGLVSVSCSSPGNCVAVGNYQSNAEVFEALILTERNGRWQRGIEAPLPAGAPVAGQDASLLDVTCTAAGAVCTATGKYVDAAGHQQGLLLRGSGAKWTAAASPAAPSTASADPNLAPLSVACVDADDCAAVGTYANPLRNSLGLLLSETGGTWSSATGAQLPANAAPASTVGVQTNVLASVACPQLGGCTAVGWYFDNDGNGQGLLVSQTNGTWQPGVEVTLPANAVKGLRKQSAGLDWISCASAGNCLATGVYTDAGDNTQALLLSEVGGTWQTGLESPLPRNGARVEFAAADQSECTGAGTCTVIGQYNDAHANVLGYALSESGGSWGKPTELRPPPVSAAQVQLSLAAILEPYGKSGTLARIRAAHRFVFTFEAAEAGTAATVWYARAHGKKVTVGAGEAKVRGAGRSTLDLRLTGAGRRLLAGAKRIKISAGAAFTPRGKQRPEYLSFTFTLR